MLQCIHYFPITLLDEFSVHQPRVCSARKVFSKHQYFVLPKVLLVFHELMHDSQTCRILCSIAGFQDTMKQTSEQ